MNSSFYTLFRRGKYYHANYHAKQSVDDNEQSKAEQERDKREQRENERFAVAAIAFCLKHDESFRRHFFEKVCRQNDGSELNGDFRIEFEPKPWADLKIQNAGREYVIEFKIGARLEPKQNPNNDEFNKKPDGYGFKMQENGIQRYTVLGKENLGLGDRKIVKVQGSEIICRECSWNVLSDGLESSKQSPMLRDLFDCLASLGIEHFEFIKAEKIQVKLPLNEAVGALLVFDAIKKRLDPKGSY